MAADVFIHQVGQYDAAAIESFLEESCASVFKRINPGMRVVLKPNWVRQGHSRDENSWQALITHPDVISAVLTVTLRRLHGSGHILICDAPQTDSSFSELLSRYPVDRWKKNCEEKGISFEILDLREDEWVTERDTVVARKKLTGDPLGSTEVNLTGPWSEFYGHRPSVRGYYGADYDIAETNAAHNGWDNRYRVSRSVMKADVFINLPKLKTHLKAGITANLKNLVGINTYKNLLPHYTLGCPDEGGDQFPGAKARQRLEAAGGKWLKQRVLTHPLLAKLFSYVKPLLGRVMGTDDVIRSGCWHGNDTLWRMVLDLNKILFYADSAGRMGSAEERLGKVYIGVVDAIVAGEGDGPLRPEPFGLGQILCGEDPVVLDTVCARSLGYDYRLIPMLSHAWAVETFPLTGHCPEDIRVVVDGCRMRLEEFNAMPARSAKPAKGWHILTSGRVEETDEQLP